MPGAALSLSVVVSSYGVSRLSLLAQTVSALAHDPEGLECLLLTDHPDEVRAAVQSYAGNLKLEITPFQGGVSAQRNLGISKARGVAVALLDDDMVPRARWLAAARSLGQGPGDAIVTGPIHAVASRPVLGRKLLWLHACRRVDARGPVESLYGGNLLLVGRARVLRFDERLGPRPGQFVMLEDADFCHRAMAAGVTVFADPDLAVDHHLNERRLRWGALLRRARETGYASGLYLRFAQREGRKAPSRRYASTMREMLRRRPNSPYLAAEALSARELPFAAATILSWLFGFLQSRLLPYPSWLRSGAGESTG